MTNKNKLKMRAKKETTQFGLRNGKPVKITGTKKESGSTGKKAKKEKTVEILPYDVSLMIKRALFYTNMSYMLADMANTMTMDCENILAKIKKGLKHEEKRNFAIAADLSRRTKVATQIACKNMYEIKDTDDACDDSDYLMEILLLVIDRTGNTEESKREMLEYIKAKPSIMKINEWLRNIEILGI